MSHRLRSKLLARAHRILHVLTNVVGSIAATFIGLPDPLKYHPELWNPTTHGNISFVVVLLFFRFVSQQFENGLRWLIRVTALRGFGELGARDIILGRGCRVEGTRITKMVYHVSDE